MKRLKVSILFVCLISPAGCLDSGTDPKPVIDYGGISDYYIANQSTIDLNITYKIRPTGTDSTVAVPADSTIKIFTYGDIGGSVPVGTFSKLSFYKLSDHAMEKPLLVIKSIVNDNWDAVQNPEKGDFSWKFTRVITDEDLE